MVFVAHSYAHMGKTLSAAPVADTFLVVGAVFVGATSYVFITRKDFSYLYATLAMGFWVVFVGAIAAAFIDSNALACHCKRWRCRGRWVAPGHHEPCVPGPDGRRRGRLPGALGATAEPVRVLAADIYEQLEEVRTTAPRRTAASSPAAPILLRGEPNLRVGSIAEGLARRLSAAT